MIQGILFDKDGTLIDFFDLWLRAARSVIPKLMEEVGISADKDMENCLMESIGIFRGKVDSKGALAYKSYGEIAEDMSAALKIRGVSVSSKRIEKQLVRLFDEYTTQENVKLTPLVDLHKVLGELKKMGIRIGLATADTMASARNCLRALGVEQYFDYIGADDGVLQPKPAPDMLEDFSKYQNIPFRYILVVGDTENDMKFAKSCGSVAVGVLSGVSERADFGDAADYVLESIAEVPAFIKFGAPVEAKRTTSLCKKVHQFVQVRT